MFQPFIANRVLESTSGAAWATAVSGFIPVGLRDARVQFAAILLVALALRGVFFVGFGMGDDPSYIAHIGVILDGGYPSLDPLNQYAYRPLLLYLWAAGVALFGYTDFGIVAPMLAASIATIVIIYVFVRRLIDPRAALWCALLFACEPFNVVNSTTMTNDVILSCLVFGAVAVFLVADVESTPDRIQWRLFVAAAALLTCAFLVKMTMFPAVCALGLYSAASLRTRAATVWRGHVAFYMAFLIGLACICAVYYLKAGDPLWQFRSESKYYETFKPDWYIRGDINYSNLLWEYPQSLFGFSGYGPFRFLDHGVLLWLFVPAAVWAIVTGNRILSFLVLLALCVFLFFELYPQYMSPRYLPLVRQTRYLEMLLPAVVIVVGTALYQLSRQQPVLTSLVLIAVLGDFVYEASRRSLVFADSQQDMRALAEFATTTISGTQKLLSVDHPANVSLGFHLRGSSVSLASIEGQPPADAYVAVGGARSFWWHRDLVFDVKPEDVPPDWVLAYEVPGRTAPWRPSNLRVYFVGGVGPGFIPPTAERFNERPVCQRLGLREIPYRAGFASPPAPSTEVERVPEIDNGSSIAAEHLEWTAAFYADNDIYTFETTSDDGSWMHLNDALVLDNGGTHPAKTARKKVHLGRGWYAFKLRYEDTGGDRFLRFRVARGRQGKIQPEAPSFCLETPANQGLAASVSGW